MSELGEGFTEKSYFGPEGLSYISPLDPCNERFIQFGVLKQLGYPVDIQKVPVEEIPEEYLERNDLEWERDNFPIWVRPLVNIPDFEKYVEDLDVPGDSITSDDEEIDQKLGDHPVKLIWRVETADVHMLAYELDCFEKGKLRYLKDSGSGILTRELLVGCFMTALDRYVEKKSRGYIFWQEDTWAAVSIEDFIRYHIYQKQGFRPASPEQLGAIAFDYYKLAELAQPDLLKFKNSTAAQE